MPRRSSITLDNVDKKMVGRTIVKVAGSHISENNTYYVTGIKLDDVNLGEARGYPHDASCTRASPKSETAECPGPVGYCSRCHLRIRRECRAGICFDVWAAAQWEIMTKLERDWIRYVQSMIDAELDAALPCRLFRRRVASRLAQRGFLHVITVHRVDDHDNTTDQVRSGFAFTDIGRRISAYAQSQRQ